MAIKKELKTLARPSFAEELDGYSQEGELYQKLEDDKVLCYACGHRCVIRDGLRGICKVRYNKDGKLFVPKGYVAALQCDPTEKKPFFHVLPGSATLTFGMLGCDYHCAYCFPAETPIVTSLGVLPIEEVFTLGKYKEKREGAEISYPEHLQAVTESGSFHSIKKVFKHFYSGKMMAIKPYYFPELRCTEDHHIYATKDPGGKDTEVLEAKNLTKEYYLIIPKNFRFSSGYSISIRKMLSGNHYIETERYRLVPVQSVSSTNGFTGHVYNLEVEEEHNYLANFFLVKNCQNWLTSQALRDSSAGIEPMTATAKQMVGIAKRYGASMIGSSYNEPLITAEWAADVFRLAREQGFKTAFISNGNATREVLEYLRPITDCYKVDLKSMQDRNYRKLGGLLSTVLQTIPRLVEMGFWVEIVTLIIPGFNDSNEELKEAAKFLSSISPNIPWHVTAFHKDYKMTAPDNTPPETLIRASEIGYEAGLRFVYAGNLPGRVKNYENTCCPNCYKPLVERYGYKILDYRITLDGKCPNCSSAIAGLWW